MKKILSSLLFLTVIMTLSPNKVASSNEQLCQNQNTEASYELDDYWIVICSQNESKSLIQVDKNQRQQMMNLPAFGEFPTYAAIAGDLSDPNSIIYNISPFSFKTIEASIITNITPVINTTHQATGTQVNILSGEQQKKAMETCSPNQPVQVFETATENVYICIEAVENDENSINLSYVQESKDNLYSTIELPAKLASSTSYETNSNQTKKYRVSYQGLEIYEDDNLVETIPVTNLYLASPNKE